MRASYFDRTSTTALKVVSLTSDNGCVFLPASDPLAQAALSCCLGFPHLPSELIAVRNLTVAALSHNVKE
jgi:hypothetical protein